MKTPSCFEIRVALLGNVSAGKTTVLNALLRDKYGEVAMKRTTALPNYFVIHTSNKKEDTSSPINSKDDDDLEATIKKLKWMKIAENPRSAQETHQEITQDNKNKLSQSGGPVQEKWFDIELDEEIVPMRPDTKLILVDIPGLNEAGVFDSYKDYVKEKWHTFDCVIVVMDGKMEVNTEDQVFLLKFVKQNLSIKSVPVIILINKVDEPDDKQQTELVKKAEEEVNKIFGCTDCRSALQCVLDQQSTGKSFGSPDAGADLFAVPQVIFIPVSAVTAYIQLSASRMNFDRFKTFDVDLIHTFGREQIGRIRWNKLTEEEKFLKVYKIVTDQEECKNIFKDSNFTDFLKVLEFFIGGPESQKRLTEHQLKSMEHSAEFATFEPGHLCQHLYDLYNRLLSYEQIFHDSKTKLCVDLQKIFWTRFGICKSAALQQLQSQWPKAQCVKELTRPMAELVSYHDLASLAGWECEMEATVIQMRKLVSEYLVFLLNRHADEISLQPSIKTPNQSNSILADTKSRPMNSYEWSIVFDSVLQVSHNEYFLESFGFLEILLRSRSRSPEWIRDNFFARKTCQKCQAARSLMYPKKKNCLECPLYDPRLGTTFKPSGTLQERQDIYVTKYPSEILHLEVGDESEIFFQFPGPHNDLMRLNIPRNLSDPDHFGHLPWLFCRFQAYNESNSQSEGYEGEELGKRSFDFVFSKNKSAATPANSKTTPPPITGFGAFAAAPSIFETSTGSTPLGAPAPAMTTFGGFEGGTTTTQQSVFVAPAHAAEEPSIVSPSSQRVSKLIKTTAFWDAELKKHKDLVALLFANHASDRNSNITKQLNIRNQLGLVHQDAGSSNINEQQELIRNSCFYLSLAVSYLSGIGKLMYDQDHHHHPMNTYGSNEYSDDEFLRDADQALISQTALQLKRTIEGGVLRAHPEWAEAGFVGEEVQACSDFLVYNLDSETNILSKCAVAVFDETSGFVEIFKGSFYDEMKDDGTQRTNTLTLRFIPGHFQPLLVKKQQDKHRQRPSLEEIIKALDDEEVLYAVTGGAA